MKGLMTLMCCALAMNGMTQCFTFFTLNAIGTNATAVFEGSGAENPLYVIDWGDGQIDSSLVPVMEHSYASDGQYMATYYYSDQNNPNCSYFSFEVFILTGASCSLNTNVASISEAVLVEAFAQNTSVPLMTIDWGDGSPVLQDNNGIHAYTTPGIYEVCVSLTDGDPAFPCSINECQEVEVLGPQGACEVAFEPTVQGQDVSLAISGTGSADTPYWIDWGDGTYAESPATVHTYAIPNYYTICMYYGQQGDLSCQASACQEIYIDPFSTDCVLQMVPIVDGADVQLQVLSAGAEVPIYFVDWGDGSAGEYGFPQGYTYAASGTYLICVSYTDSLNPIGCQLNECQEVDVDISANPCTLALSVVNVGLENTYAVLAVGEGAVAPFYSISWGDNSTPLSEASGEYTYAEPGVYEICATYGDSLNSFCDATVCETVNVVTRVEEQHADVHLQVSPHPLSEEATITFQLPQPANARVEVFDVSGRCVATVFAGEVGRQLQRIPWNASALPNGIYSLRISGEDFQRVVPLIK